MKPRFEKRRQVRQAEREDAQQRRLRDRHDRAWLLGPGQQCGPWRVLSGLWYVWNETSRAELRCVSSGILQYAGAERNRRYYCMPENGLLSYDPSKPHPEIRFVSAEVE